MTAGPTMAPRWPGRGVLVTLLAISAILNLFFIGGAVWTRVHAPPEWATPEQHFHAMASQLNLTPEQRAGFDKYSAAMRARADKMHQQVGPLITAAWGEVAKPQPDIAQALKLIDEATEKRREFQREATAQTVEFLSLLSPEQRAKFVAIARERRPAWMRGPPPASR